jgi:hypothetical protein
MRTFKVLIKLILIASLAYLLQNIFAWWVVVIAALLINFIIYSKGPSSFLSGFMGVGLLWLITAMITDFSTGSILADRVAAIFSLPNSELLILVTSIIGGLAGGLGGLTGSQLRNWIMPQPNY